MLTTFSRSQAGPSAYVKIADGCDHNCAFCTIPSIKGRQVSKRPLHVFQEIVDLVGAGTKEVVLVAQDTIRYGADLGIKHGLPTARADRGAGAESPLAAHALHLPESTDAADGRRHGRARHAAALPRYADPACRSDVLRAMNRPSDVDMTRRLIDHARAKTAGSRDADDLHRRLSR